MCMAVTFWVVPSTPFFMMAKYENLSSRCDLNWRFSGKLVKKNGYFIPTTCMLSKRRWCSHSKEIDTSYAPKLYMTSTPRRLFPKVRIHRQVVSSWSNMMANLIITFTKQWCVVDGWMVPGCACSLLPIASQANSFHRRPPRGTFKLSSSTHIVLSPHHIHTEASTSSSWLR